MKKKIIMTLLIVAAYSASIAQTPSPAVVVTNKAGWTKIAERHASYKADRDEVMVLGNDHFRQIKLRVKDAPVNLTSYEIYFENDTKQSVMVNKILNSGEETMPVDIDNAHAIRKIVMDYNTVGATSIDAKRETKMESATEKEKEREREKETERERAEVEIWGLK